MRLVGIFQREMKEKRENEMQREKESDMKSEGEECKDSTFK